MLFTATQLSHLTSVSTARLIVAKVHIKRCFTPKKFHFHCRHFSQIIEIVGRNSQSLSNPTHTETPTDPLHISFDHQEIASFEVASMTQKNTWSLYCLKNLRILSQIPKPRALLVQSTFSRQYFITRSVVTRHVENRWAFTSNVFVFISLHPGDAAGQCCHNAACLCQINRCNALWKILWNRSSKLKAIGLVRALESFSWLKIFIYRKINTVNSSCFDILILITTCSIVDDSLCSFDEEKEHDSFF